jgi:hypothetical protein
MRKTKYPVYVLSKGRYDKCKTAMFLEKDEVDYKLVVEIQEYEEYAKRFDKSRIIVLPKESTGRGAIPVRNFIWQHSIDNGHERHWELDDNMHMVYRLWKGKRVPCNSFPAIRACEDFTDRYENIAISGLNYSFAIPWNLPAFYLNVHVYSFMLIRNDLTYRWRGEWNADTDLCLQVLSGGWCTVLLNAFMCAKNRTMKGKGGNTDRYQGDGRLKMARSLERQWPGVVKTRRRFGRPQHYIHRNWRNFDTQLIRKKGIEFAEDTEYGLKVKQVADEIVSPKVKKIMTEFNSKNER